jgi:hypothetical protein
MDRDKSWLFISNVSLKATLFFLLLNLVFAVFYPRSFLGSISAYNWLFPGRERFPHGDVPEKANNITTSNLEAMFHSHVISKSKENEFRVAIIGDSSVWGFLQETDQTFTAKLNEMGLMNTQGRKVRFYNLGYPTLSVTKDLLLLERSIRYEPDMILWFVTLESLPVKIQLESPLLKLNPIEVSALLDQYELDLPGSASELSLPSLVDRTIVGSRFELSELWRLQLYGFAWAATGVDHYIPESYNERAEDLSAEVEYKGFDPGELSVDELFFRAFEAGTRIAGDVPIIFVNEPIFISEGTNSDLRYNYFYPRWAYDEYRSVLKQQALMNGWTFLDFWDVVPSTEFTDSAIHYTPVGTDITARVLASYLETEFDFKFAN